LNANVVFVGQELVAAYARVHSRIAQNPDVTISSIEYRLFESDSRWAVYDIVLDGRSLVSNYRSRFNAISLTPRAQSGVPRATSSSRRLRSAWRPAFSSAWDCTADGDELARER
jgi:hypothetical protein